VLGSIRRHLSKETLRRTVEEIPKDISWLSQHDLERYLSDKRLPAASTATRIAKGD
jgi:protein required for attachment to host cells